MKHYFILITFSWLVLVGLSTSAKAEITESNLTFQIKVYNPLPYKENGDKWVDNYQIITYKTGDIAQKLAAKKNFTVSKNAQIILRSTQTNAGSSSRYYVRDKAQGDIPVDITDITVTYRHEIYKASGSKSKITSSYTALSNGDYEVTLGADEMFFYSGSIKTVGRKIISKEDAERRLFLISRNLSGHGYFKSGNGGAIREQYSTAIIKVSPPKVLPTPQD